MPNTNSIFFILCDFGPKIGRAWIERDPGAMDWQSTIDDLASGEISGMIEVREAEGWVDVTREAALAVSTKWSHSDPVLKDNHYSFVEQHLGTRAARSFVRAT